MRIPDRHEAELWLQEAGVLNPGPWVAHSRYVAEAAHNIAARLPSLEPDAAYVLGLLHDIGRRAGVTGMRHVLDGYTFLAAAGCEDAAGISLTHSFQNRDGREIFGEWDCTPEELTFIDDYLAQVEYDDYDRLIQLCDALANASGFCLMEKRMLDVGLRYGINEYAVAQVAGDVSTSRLSSSSAWDVRCTACCRASSKTRLASRCAELRPSPARPDTSSALCSQG